MAERSDELGTTRRARTSRPPEEYVGPASWSQIARIWVGVLLVVAAANLPAAYVRSQRRQAAPWLIEQKWQLLQSLHEPADWLVLGDSSGHHGTDPAVLEAGLGGTAINLCTVGQPWHDVWILETYLQRCGAPKHVVLVHTYDAWQLEPSPQYLAQIPLPFGFWSRLQPPVGLGLGEAGEVALMRHSPLYGERYFLQDLLRFPVGLAKKVLCPSRYPLIPQRRSEPIDARGFQPLTGHKAGGVAADLRNNLAFLRRHAFEMTPGNRAALQRMAFLAEEYHFDLYVAHGPVLDELAASPQFKSYLRDEAATLSELCAEHPRLHYLGGGPMEFPADELHDTADHVVGDAAKRFTTHLVDLLEAVRPTR